jgi:DNA-binding SARP family transcriptional activator/TolB-like protein
MPHLRETQAQRRLRPVIAAARDIGAKVEISLLGGVSVRAEARALPVTCQKGRALLGYLAWVRAEGVKRESLCGLLWSESPEPLAQSSLRQSLRSLKRSLGQLHDPLLQATRTDVGLHLVGVAVDVHEILAAVERGEIPDRLLNEKRIHESLFAGAEDLDPAFRVWLLVQRAALGDRLTRTLERFLEAEDPRLRRDGAEALANLDPTHEWACRMLMQLHAARGDTASALRLYKRLWDLLDDEYDMEPSEPTQALVAEIKQGALTMVPGIARLPLEPARTVVGAISAGSAATGVRLRLLISRFKSEGLAADKAYLVDGFRQELVVSLIRFREWIVIDDDLPVVSDRERTPADYLLFAAARSVGDDVHLLLTLYDHHRGEYLWSDRRTVSLQSWFESQQQIVRRIAIALNVHLSAERLSRTAGQSDVMLEVYDRWLVGQNLSFRWRPEDERRAEDIFKGIIADAPRFAPAYSSLVQILNSRHLVCPGLRRQRAVHAEALALARQAVQLDPLDSRTHLSLAWSFAMNGRFDVAETSYLTARDLNENDPWTLVSSALGLAYCGNCELAGALAAQAIDVGLVVAPLHWGYHSGVRFLCGEYEECIDAAERAQDVPFYVPGWKVAALGHLGDLRRARAEARAFLDLIAARWHGNGAATDEQVVTWFLHCFPIGEQATWEQLRDGLRLAGMPVAPDCGRVPPA